MDNHQKRYFLEFKGADCSAIRWVLKAIGKNNHIQALNRLLIEGRKAIATDSHRIHVADLQGDYPPGLYKPFVINQNKVYLLEELEEIKYPGWQWVFLKYRNDNSISLNDLTSINYTVLVRYIADSITLSYDYFIDLGRDHFTAYFSDIPKDGILFKSEDGKKQAIIMPMRIW